MADRLQMSTEFLDLRTTHPFIIARGGRSEYRTVWVRLRDGDGNEGWGEAAPSKFYGETAESAMAALPYLAAALPSDPFDLEGTERRLQETMRYNAAARAAVSAALHDLAAKRLGVPLYRLWGLDPARAPRSTFTIGLDTAEKIRAKVKEAAEYPILKVKLGTDHDVEVLRTIRETTDREIRVDANCGWTVKQAIAMLPVLQEFGVTVLEQPLPPISSTASARSRGAPRFQSSPTRAARPPPISRRSWARWTASTSSSPSAVASARRSG